VRIWLKRLGVVALLLLAAAGAWTGWRYGHPASPPADRELPVAALAPGQLRAQFFGTTTLLFRDGDHAVMVDALLSRRGLRDVMFRKLASDPVRIDWALRRGKVGRVDLLLVSHSHYDHVFDAPAVAKATGAVVAGSPSTHEVLRGEGVPDSQFRLIRGGEQFQAGDFHVTVFRSLHSPGDAVPGTIDRPLAQPAKVADYKQGGTFGFLIEHRGVRILAHGSANYVPGMYRGVRADVVFLAVGRLGALSDDFAARYWREVVGATGAKLVVPIHWDDFMQPLDEPMLPLRRFMDDVPAGMARVEALAVRDHVAIRTMPVIDPVDIAAAAGR
jgi:L-ascorbate metabolism protein UlaG (beta-lactamase superfamily)